MNAATPDARRRPAGREQELERVRRALFAPASAGPRLVVLTGSAGMGKTTLVDALVREATESGVVVQSALGTPSEMHLPLAALISLFLDEFTSRPALAALLSDSEPQARGPELYRLAYMLARELEATGSSPLSLRMIVLDDAQWADPTSLAVLTLLASHLADTPLRILLSMRTGDRVDPSDIACHARIDLEGLNAEQAMTIVRTVEGEGANLDPLVRALIVDRAEGSPMALVELTLSARSHGSASIGEAQLLTVLGRRLDALSPGARHIARAVTLDEDITTIRSVENAYPGALLELVEQRVLTIDASRIRFVHPLLRDLCADQLNAPTRRDLHRELASSLHPDSDPDRFARHLAEATFGPDETAANMLAEFANRSGSRGALMEASGAMLRAAEITPDATLSTQRLLRAADLMLLAGDPAGAISLARQAGGQAPDPELRAEADWQVVVAGEWELRPEDVVQELIRLAQLFRTENPLRGIEAFSQASRMAYLAGDLERGVTHAAECIEQAEANSDDLNVFVGRAHLCWNLALRGDPRSEEELAIVGPLMQMLASSDELTYEGLLVAQRVGIQHIIDEEWTEAEAVMGLWRPRARKFGVPLSETLLAMMHGAMLFRFGRLDEAHPLCTTSLSPTKLPVVSLAWSSSAAAQLCAAMGRVDETKALAERAMDAATRAGVPLAIAWTHVALGHLALSSGNIRESVREFDLVSQFVDTIGLRDPGFIWWHGDRIDAFVQSGRNDEAQAIVTELEAVKRRPNRSIIRGTIARGRGQLSNSANQASVHFAESVRVFTESGAEFELARTEQIAARHLATLGATRLANDYRIAAKARFERCGAPMWAALCDKVSRLTEGSGLPAAVRPDNTAFAELSPSERRVLDQMAAGQSTAEVATALGLSARTVQFHLTATYRKLGVSRRAELVALVTDRAKNQRCAERQSGDD